MNKSTKRLIVGLVIVTALVIIGYYIWKRYTPKNESNLIDLGKGTVTPKNVGFTDAIDRNLKMKKGVKGNNVIELQKAINAYIDRMGSSVTKITVDGNFGVGTEKAMSQSSYGTYTSAKGGASINDFANRNTPFI